jgi:CRP/FNR family cyclic AMP-dependent transcriptional regulator
MDFAATMVSPHRQFMINLRSTIWAQEGIGDLSGISRQRVNQALQTLEKEGRLRVEYGGVTILDLEGLRNHGT